jgi:hypothetical protein
MQMYQILQLQRIVKVSYFMNENYPNFCNAKMNKLLKGINSVFVTNTKSVAKSF